MTENGTAVFRVPPGGRLMIQVPEGDNEVVYDSAQGAAVRRGAQQNDEGKADAPEGAQRGELRGQRPMTDAEVAAARNQPSNTGSVRANLGPGGAQPVSQPQQPAGSPSMRAPERNLGQTHTVQQSPVDKAKAEAEAKAKQQQQSGSGRPAGETPPKPGSPVGSPPSGNEGNK
jgi:hypothetical protein